MIAETDCAFRYFKADPKRYNDEIIAISHRSENSYDVPKSFNGLFDENSHIIPETLTALLKRTASFIHDTIEPLALSTDKSDQTNVLISGHGAVNKAILMYFNGTEDLNRFWDGGLQPNCGINKITCTCNDSGKIIYEVQDKCLVLYNSDLEKGLKKLL